MERGGRVQNKLSVLLSEADTYCCCIEVPSLETINVYFVSLGVYGERGNPPFIYLFFVFVILMMGEATSDRGPTYVKLCSLPSKSFSFLSLYFSFLPVISRHHLLARKKAPPPFFFVNARRRILSRSGKLFLNLELIVQRQKNDRSRVHISYIARFKDPH